MHSRFHDVIRILHSPQKKEPDIITNKWVSLQMDNKGMKRR